MARKVGGIEAGRIERLARTLAPELAGGHLVSVSTWSVPAVEEWRAAARKAARQLGEPIRTGITAEGTRVWATLLRPVTDADLQAATRVLDELFAGAKTNARTDGTSRKPRPAQS